MKKGDLILLSGSSNLPLAEKIAKALEMELGTIELSLFPNGERRVHIATNTKNRTVYLIQSISTPPDQMLVELLLMADAAKRMGAGKVVGIIPWLGYSAQDKVFREGEPLSSELIAHLIKTAGISEVITLDLHSPNNIDHLKKAGLTVTHLSALEIFIQAFKGILREKEWTVLSLDKGALERSRLFAKNLQLPLVSLKKSRDLSTGSVSFNDFTGDVRDKNIISFDDFVSTGGTRIKASAILKDLGVKTYVDCITHGLLGNDAAQKIQESHIDSVYLSDSYPIPPEKQVKKINILTSANLFAAEIKKRHS